MSHRPRALWIASTAALLVVALSATERVQKPLLRAFGRLLVIDSPLHRADVAVITADAGGGGVLEAADLVQHGVVPGVAMLGALPDPADREFERRGVLNESAATVGTRQLRALGVGDVEQIPRVVGGTEDEGVVLAEWCQQRKVESLIVVSAPDHTRRLGRVLRRRLDPAIRVMVKPARYSSFDPDRWWETRAGVRTEIIELQKLLLDVVRHPLS